VACYSDTKGGSSDTLSHAHVSDSEDNANQALKAETPSALWNTLAEDTSIIANLPIIGEKSPKTDACYYDSGASRHVFHDRTAFETYEEIQPLTVKGFGHKFIAFAVGCGTVRLRVRCGNQESSILLTNVLHLPIAHSNLVSGLGLDDSGLEAWLIKRAVLLLKDGVRVITGAVHNNMYQLDVTIIRPTTPVPSTQSSHPPSTNAPTIATTDTDRQDFHIAY
jgi:hypothetical protein